MDSEGSVDGSVTVARVVPSCCGVVTFSMKVFVSCRTRSAQQCRAIEAGNEKTKGGGEGDQSPYTPVEWKPVVAKKLCIEAGGIRPFQALRACMEERDGFFTHPSEPVINRNQVKPFLYSLTHLTSILQSLLHDMATDLGMPPNTFPVSTTSPVHTWPHCGRAERGKWAGTEK